MKEKNITMEEVLKERIKENEGLFSKEELEVIERDFFVVKKIYLLGLINGRDIYANKL